MGQITGPRQIIWSPEAQAWRRALPVRQRIRISGAAQILAETGPTLGRPLVDRVHSSRHHNMKELRVPGGNVRVLFAFDGRGRAVMLTGGDKTRDGNGWYPPHVKQADRIFDRHIRHNGEEPPWATSRRGPAPRTR